MAEELQREAEARSAALVEGGESNQAVQEAGPALVLAEADGNESSAGQRCSSSHHSMLGINILLRRQPSVLCQAAPLLSCAAD